MAKITLYPSYGTFEQSSSVKFEIFEIGYDNFVISAENATHFSKAEIRHLKDMGSGRYGGVVDLKVPEHSSHSAISVFFHINEVQEDGSYKTLEICPSIFEIREEVVDNDKEMIVSPSFISTDDVCSVMVKGDPLSSASVSINDKIFKIHINEKGYGTIHFTGKDVVSDTDLETINKFPVYIYDGKNRTGRTFTGSYVNIIPSGLTLRADIGVDPRCDPNDPAYVDPIGSWTRPEECDDIEGECNPETDDCDPPDLCISPIEIRTSCDSGNIEISDDICRVHSNSAIVMNNGMALHVYLSPDKTYEDLETDPRYNINRVFLSAYKTSLDVQVIANRDVVIEPKAGGSPFKIHIDDDLANFIGEVGDIESANIYVVFYDESIGFQKIKISSIELDEYAGYNIATGDVGNTSATINGWMFCVNSVWFRDSTGTNIPDIYLFNEDNYYSLPYVRNSFETGSYVQPVNVSIASNKDYVGLEEEVYVYVVVEAVTENNISQLYFNSMSFGKDSSFNQKTYGWVRLTDETQGNNRNPRTVVDKNNSLHIVFESDRGNISQLYYGVLGPNSTSFAASTFSSSVDKYVQFSSKEISAFDYFTPLLLKLENGSEYNPIPEIDTEHLLEGPWVITEQNNGDVKQESTIRYLDDLVISANPLYQEAMASVSFEIFPQEEIADPSIPIPFTQLNYQISFNMSAVITQTSELTSENVISNREMDNLFDEWKEGFVVAIDDRVANQPVYKDAGNNKFVLGRKDNVFDRIVPIVGSYAFRVNNPSVPYNTQIKILKNDNNLKDFTLGLMFEKTYFRATNIMSLSDYLNDAENIVDGNDSGDYISDITEKIYTGNAKLVAFIRTQETNDIRADYIIVREFPELLDVGTNSSYDIMVNYVSINSSEVNNIVNTYGGLYEDRFLGTMTLMKDNIPKFSQSFVSNLVGSYNYIDVGFGVPYGGYYVADKMSPSKLGIFDETDATLTFRDIEITSPTYIYNEEVVGIPPTVRDMTSLRVSDSLVTAPSGTSFYIPDGWENDLISMDFFEKEEIKYFAYEKVTNGTNFSRLYDVSQVEKISIEFVTYAYSDRIQVTTSDRVILHDSGFIVASEGNPYKFDVDVSLLNDIYIDIVVGPEPAGLSYDFTAYFKKVHSDNGFIQIPITFEGINQSASIDNGICNDIHLAWQSNRNRYWDVYYANSVNELSPFRHETRITETESNSIKPDLSVNRHDSRMIVWNDNRNGNYSIFSARSVEDPGCNQKSCETSMAENFSSFLEECSISVNFRALVEGVYYFVLNFYSDNGVSNLYKTIELDGSEDRWFVDGVSIVDSLTYNADGTVAGISLSENQIVNISYYPDKNDKIFDIVLYFRLSATRTS